MHTPRVVAITLVLALAITACGPSVSSPVSPGPTAAPAKTSSAYERFQAQMDSLREGTTVAPSSIDWPTIESGTALTSQTSELCKVLGTQGADDAIAAILTAGLKTLWWRLRRQPISSETENLVEIASTFTTAACPLWDPVLFPAATPAPIAPWYPAGFTPMLFQSDVAWRWAEAGTVNCELNAGCYALQVVTQTDCPGVLAGTISTYDDVGNVLEVIQDRRFAFLPGTTTLQFDPTDTSAIGAYVLSIVCT